MGIANNIELLNTSVGRRWSSYQTVLEYKMEVECLKLAGLWYLSSDTSDCVKVIYWIYNKIVFAAIAIFSIGLLTDIIINYKDLVTFTDSGCIFVGISVVSFKAVVFQCKKSRIDRLVHSVRQCESWTSDLVDPAAMSLLKKYKIRERVTILGFSCLGCVLVIALIFFVPRETGELPIRCWYPFDTTVTPMHQIVFGIQSFAVAVGMIAIIGMDNTVFVLCGRVLFQLEILAANFQSCSLDINASGGRSETNPHKDFTCFRHTIDCGGFFERYRKCVMHHQYLILLVDEVNDVFGSSMFSQLLSSSLIICLTGFQSLLVVGHGTNFLKFAIYLGAAFSQLLYWCCLGNELSHQSSLLLESQWKSGWEMQPAKKVLHPMVFSMMRSNKKLELKASNFFIMSTETFITILSKSYSIFALLNNMIQ
uniref:Odorant receptor n=1 Tax=Cephus cinctus TaxID=211228 RepID=A0A1W6L199_CEPCN|nr:odorant receptor 19 [Cephus cinctus]